LIQEVNPLHPGEGQTLLENEKKRPATFTDLLRLRFKGVLDPVGAFFNRLGLMPNTITILGLVGNMIGAYFLFRGQMTIGGILILLMGPVDALDGTMARLRGMDGAFGAFVDSVTDRYSELIIMGALVIYYSQNADWLGATWAYLAASGSVLVSYTRARAQSLGIDSKVGILTRVERYLVMAPTLIFNIPLVGLGIIALFSNITAIQRILDVRSQFHHPGRSPKN
jgi:CDP-diacylglycerol---glycerol-3-phosphate 3-phosphatidyltransferase